MKLPKSSHKHLVLYRLIPSKERLFLIYRLENISGLFRATGQKSRNRNKGQDLTAVEPFVWASPGLCSSLGHALQSQGTKESWLCLLWLQAGRDDLNVFLNQWWARTGCRIFIFSLFSLSRSLRWAVQTWFCSSWSTWWPWWLGSPRCSGLEARRPVLSGPASSTGAGKKSEHGYFTDKPFPCCPGREFGLFFHGRGRKGWKSHCSEWSKEEQNTQQLKKSQFLPNYSLFPESNLHLSVSKMFLTTVKCQIKHCNYSASYWEVEWKLFIYKCASSQLNQSFELKLKAGSSHRGCSWKHLSLLLILLMHWCWRAVW